MPPRMMRWLIVIFWLTTTGWLIWRDLWPSWRPGEPPPFHIDDVEEVVQKTNNPQKTGWTVERGSAREDHLVKVFQAKTWVAHHEEDDTYSLHASLDAPKALKFPSISVGTYYKIYLMTSEYRVTRAGRLHSLRADVKTSPQPDQSQGDLFPTLGPLLRKYLVGKTGKSVFSEAISLSMWGEVRDDHFTGHCQVKIGEHESKQLDLPPTAVSYTGSVLMPLHPVSQISGLRPGQRWRQPLVDPLRDAFASLSLPGFSGGLRYLNAHVLPQAEMLQIGDGESSCLVIEYTNDENERIGRTWVEQGSSRVLQQEAILEDSRWVMKREVSRRSSRSLFGG